MPAEPAWTFPVSPSVAFAAGASGKNPLPLASLLEGASGDDIPVQWQAGWRATAAPVPRPLFPNRPSTARAILVGAGAGFVVLVTCAVLFGQKLVDALHATGIFGDGP